MNNINYAATNYTTGDSLGVYPSVEAAQGAIRLNAVLPIRWHVVPRSATNTVYGYAADEVVYEITYARSN